MSPEDDKVSVTGFSHGRVVVKETMIATITTNVKIVKRRWRLRRLVHGGVEGRTTGDGGSSSTERTT